jgi:radical SAM superfamily enzyme YgiQ (UPF0313 family)
MSKKQLRVIYIRPSRYDDDGYVVRFWRGVLPSNTLCCLESLTQSIAESGELGEDVEISVDVYDDTVQRIPIRRIARLDRDPDTRVVVGFVGVQSNQFARVTDLALELREQGVQVMIGGFHVSGMLALFDSPSYELQRLLDQGVTLVKGEAEAPGALVRILRDAAYGEMRPIYDIREFPDLEHAPVPHAGAKLQRKFFTKTMATIDTSRGCPFNCSFCTIINVQGRKMRHRSSACVLKAIEENYDRGISEYFFTDDNFSRNPVWEEILDGLIALRALGKKVSFMMQVDTLAHKIPGFVDKASRAGCYLAFIGMESVNSRNLEAVGKRQNHAGEYAAMVETWRSHEILVHVGYIVGLPFDTRESVRADMETLSSEVKVDLASLFMLTPLPGSKDHQTMIHDCVGVDADYNNYDGMHETFRHPRMAPGDWRGAYDDAMHYLYSKENIVTRLLNNTRDNARHMFWAYAWYRYSAMEGAHPMATGLFRLKDRKSRRSLFARESMFRYAWRRVKDAAHGAKRYAGLFLDFQEIWLLTRKPDDPRWKTLGDLRARWADVQRRIDDCDMSGKYDEAAQEMRAMLTSAADRLGQLSRAGVHLSRSARRSLTQKKNEIDAYLRAFDVRPGWRRIADAERFMSESILNGYEDAVIRYVAQRRRFNEYRHEFFQRLKNGQILSLHLGRIPYALLFELTLACKFAFQMLLQR